MTAAVAPLPRWVEDPVTASVHAELARRGISVNRLPSLVGKSQSYWSRRMTGELEFTVGDLRAIARVCGVSVVTFFENDENAPRPDGPRGGVRARRDSNPQPSELESIRPLATVIEFPEPAPVIDLFTRELIAS